VRVPRKSAACSRHCRWLSLILHLGHRKEDRIRVALELVPDDVAFTIHLTVCRHVGLGPSGSGNGVEETLAIQRRQSASRNDNV
jgi:hypothetical protein